MPKFEYAPAPESRAVVDLQPSYGLFIDGEFADPASGQSFKTVSPSTEEVLAEVAEGDAADVDRAVRAARRAYDRVWSKMSGAERGKYLFRIARILQERSRELAVLESLDNGKPIKESRDVDVPQAAAWFFYYAGWADKLDHAGLGPDPKALGVAGQVIPWNFPLLMLAWKIAPALACGNTVVLKPAETTPLTALLFAEICQQADLPAGVVNIVTGAGATGQALVEHPDVDKVAFTGSTEVGKRIARAVAGSRKKVTLELGGKGANIVYDDAPIDQAVEGIVTGIFFNQGHVCCAGSRLLVQESVADDVVERLKRRLATLRVGDPTLPETQMGPVATADQLARIEQFVSEARDEGAQIVAGGERAAVDGLESGFFFAPTLVSGADAQSRIAQEEVFGPVLLVAPFDREDEVVALANGTPFGLAAGVWTLNVKRAHRVARRLQAGTVWINVYRAITFNSPFGGYKSSGYGRENGIEAMDEFLQTKSVWCELGDEIQDPFVLKT
jgi:acyl-CoA reductase-like NAD-dependent aldehyde dehydrogenase